MGYTVKLGNGVCLDTHEIAMIVPPGLKFWFHRRRTETISGSEWVASEYYVYEVILKNGNKIESRGALDDINKEHGLLSGLFLGLLTLHDFDKGMGFQRLLD